MPESNALRMLLNPAARTHLGQLGALHRRIGFSWGRCIDGLGYEPLWFGSQAKAQFAKLFDKESRFCTNIQLCKFLLSTPLHLQRIQHRPF